MKDNKGLYLTVLGIGLAVSALTDALILKKLFRTKTIATENNREILDHDQQIWNVQDEIDNIKKELNKIDEIKKELEELKAK